MSAPEWLCVVLCAAVLGLFMLTELDAWHDRWERKQSEQDHRDEG